MKIHDVTPGSPEWHALRARCRCASEAPAVMGASRHLSRQDLVRMKALGLEKEFTDYVQKNVIDRGHEIEASAREIVESLIGEDLFPAVVTDDDERELASLDGMDMGETLIFECKSWNSELEAMLQRGAVDDPHYYWQLEHQLMVAPQAERVIFTVSDGTDDNTKTIDYTRVPGRREELLRGWAQFEQDVASYEHTAEPVQPVGHKVKATLPALVVELSGQVIESNLDAFKESMLAVIAAVNTDLQTDQDFADAKEGAKFCEDIEGRVKVAKEQALSKMTSVEEAFKVLDEIGEEARKQRLTLERLVKERDVALKAEIVQGGKTAFAEHIAALNTRLGKPYMPAIATDFPACIRNKRSFKNMRDAIATELARAKIEANRIADVIDVNLKMLREVAAEHTFLFPEAETAQLVLKDAEACRAIAEKKIGDYRAEQDRVARAAEEKRQREVQEAEEKRQREEAAAAARSTAAQAAHTTSAVSGAPQTTKHTSLTPEGELVHYEAPTVAASNVRPLPGTRAAAPLTVSRPSDDQIVEALVQEFGADEVTVIGWLRSFSLRVPAHA